VWPQVVGEGRCDQTWTGHRAAQPRRQTRRGERSTFYPNRHVMQGSPGPRVRLAIVSFVLSFLAFSADAEGTHSNIGEACEKQCRSTGPCTSFCGTAGKCCRIGEVSSGCDGTEGTSATRATCTPNPASAAVVCDGGAGSFGQQVRTRYIRRGCARRVVGRVCLRRGRGETAVPTGT
jgi:hypothetical protein